VIVLIDGDLLVYRCGFAAERTEYAVDYTDPVYDEAGRIWAENKKGAVAVAASLEEKGITSEITPHKNLEPVANALYNVKSMIATMLDSLQATDDDVIICLSGPTNYRTEVATLKEYKGNRDPEHKPTHGPAIKDYMAKTWQTIYSENEEADDMLGYMQYSVWKDDPYGSVIVSIDKDLDMIPGLHYNFLKDESYHVDEDDANAFFWTQLLMGDSTDNIPGVPGVGPKKAEKYMAPAWHWSNSGEFDEEHAYAIARALYVQGYGEEKADEALLENGQLLWIRRKEGELWRQPS
jgi:hypothetical protein